MLNVMTVRGIMYAVRITRLIPIFHRAIRLAGYLSLILTPEMLIGLMEVAPVKTIKISSFVRTIHHLAQPQGKMFAINIAK
jgi:hypothetical protein